MDLKQSGKEAPDTYATFADLYNYCYLVASVVGLDCIRIFGYTDPRAEKLAEETGIAFQLTNILREWPRTLNAAASIFRWKTSPPITFHLNSPASRAAGSHHRKMSARCLKPSAGAQKILPFGKELVPSDRQ